MNDNLRNAKILKKIARSYIGYKIGKPKPFSCTYFPTLRCNLSCVFCPVVSSPPKNSKDNIFTQNYSRGKRAEMTTKQAKYAIDQIEKLGISCLGFTGGEPLLREDLEELARYAKEKNMLTTLTTNGTLITKERAKSLKNCFDSIVVSLHGLKDIDEKIKQLEGSFKKSVDGLKFLKKYSKESSTVGIHFVVNKYNYHQIEDVLNFAKKNCNSISYLPIHSEFNSEFFLDEKTAKKVAMKLLALKEKNKKFIINTKKFLKLFDRALAGKFPKKQIKCEAFNLFLSLGPAGEIGGCCHPFTVGNILEENIESLFKSGKSKKQELKKTCASIMCYEQEPLFRTMIGASKIFLKNLFKSWKI